MTPVRLGKTFLSFIHTKTHQQAWNNINLTRLAEKIKSPLVLYVVSRFRPGALLTIRRVVMFEPLQPVHCLLTIAIRLFMGN